MTDFETSPGTSRFLPDLPEAAAFSHPFWAEVFGRYWSDDTLVNFSDALKLSIDCMEPAQLFAARNALGIDPRSPNTDREVTWWHQPDDLTLDEAGIIRATIGTLSDLQQFVRTNIDTIAASCEYEAEAALAAAFQQAYGENVDWIVLEGQLADEVKRRQKRFGSSEFYET